MSYPVRKLVRDAVKSALANSTTGFNARLAATASAYSLTAWVIDYAAGSENFLQAYMASTEDVDLTQIIVYPAQVLYVTTVSATAFEKPRPFSGDVLVNLDTYLEYSYRRDGVSLPEEDNIEVYGDLVLDVLTQIFQVRGWVLPAGVTYSGRFQCQPDPAIPLGDGWRQRIPFQALFGVHL